MLIVILIVLSAAVLVASAIHRHRRSLPPDVEFHVTNGVVSCLIHGSDPIDDRAWFDSLTPEERQAHLDWETAETEKWLKWASEQR